MKISDIKIRNRFRKDIGELSSLKNSINEIGLLQPIVIDENNNLIAGYRRLIAFKELGKTDIPVNKINIENSLKGEYDENAIRKNFTPSESVAIWGAMESYQLTGKKRPSSESDEPRKKASKLLKTSTDTLSKAKQVVQSQDKTLIEMMDRTGNVNKAYRYIKQKKDEEKIIKEQPKLETKGKFKTILIDPAWEYYTIVLTYTFILTFICFIALWITLMLDRVFERV